MRQGSKIVYFLDKVSLIKDGGARKELPVNHVDATKSMVGLESTRLSRAGGQYFQDFFCDQELQLL